MYVLDTDHVSLVEWGSGADAQRLRSRLQRTPRKDVASTIVSYEEQTRGRLAYLARASSEAEVVEAYRRMARHLEAWREIPVLPFDAKAAIEFQRLRRIKLRVATLDLRIAAIALVWGAVVLTRNSRDFQGVPGLTVEDWTADS